MGVALDNAIAAARAQPDPEKRLVKVAVYAQGGFVMLRFEHYTETPPELGPDGLPLQDPAAWGQHDPPLGEQLVHPADPVPSAQKQMIGPKKHLRPSHPRPQGPAEGAAGAFFTL